MNRTPRSSFHPYAALLLVFMALALLSAGAHAAPLPWGSKPFKITANDKPLADFLRELAASQGTTAVVDPSIEGTISGRFSVTGGAQSLLENIASTYAFTWYYDGAFLYIDPVSEVVSEVIPIPSGSSARVREALARSQIVDPRFPLTVNEREGSAFVSGPKRYVELVKQAVTLAADPSRQAERAEIRFFPLKYARASDFRVNRDGKEVAIAGVASVLRGLFSRTDERSSTASVMRTMRVGPTRQLRLSTGETAQVPTIEGFGAQEATPVSAGAPSLPQFQADTGLNAVLVRDYPERMDQYEKLIASLDVRPRLIEIEVTIMDISSDRLDSLGIDWRLHGRHVDLQFGLGDNAAMTFSGATTEAGQTGNATPRGAVFTGSIGHSLRNYLLTRVSALAETGQANFVARPRVSTLDNTEAVLENTTEFFVRVGGFQDAGLFKVQSGTSIRVTPLIIDESQGRGVMLTIDIADGSVGPALSDNIPSVRRRTVLTQAIVEEEKSLLIAGYSSEETTTMKAGVPGISAVPVIGNLFKHDEKRYQNMERFYLLTPRLVLAGAPAAKVGVAPEIRMPTKFSMQ